MNLKDEGDSFVKFYTGYFLDEKFPELTNTERKICAMLKLGMSSKDIAAITMTQPESVDITRSRLRKKLNLTRDKNLTGFLNRL